MIDPSLAAVFAAFDLPADGATATPAPSGLIHQTLLLHLADGRRYVLQRMHHIFTPEVVDDIDDVTAHLQAAGLETPRPLRTAAGPFTHTDPEGKHWRLLTFLDGDTIDKVDSPARAELAGRLVARFHTALADYTRPFRFRRLNVHDTPAHLARLQGTLGLRETPDYDRLAPLAEAILAEARDLPALGSPPRRVCHGDLKISNVLFHQGQARALIDLDTMGHQLLAYELGDAWRSWCNPLAEDVEVTRFDPEVLAAAARGYGSAARLEATEAATLVPGLLTVCVELAARFCVDAFEDRYFGWNPKKFPSRREHNRVRATGQLTLARAVRASLSTAEAAVRKALS